MARHKGPNTGSVYEDKKRGRWVGSVELPAGSDGRRRRRRVFAADESTAREKLAKLLAEEAAGIDIDSARLTVGDLFDAWARKAMTKTSTGTPRAASTVANYEWSIAKMRSVIGKRRLSDLRPRDVENMLETLAEEGAALSSLQRHRFVLRKVIRWAQRHDMVRSNVAEIADLPGDAKARRDPRALTVEEAGALLEASKTHVVKIPRTARTETRPRRLEALWTVSLLMGLRPGEVTGLRWSAVDFDENVLHVRTSMKYRDGTAVGLGEVKTGNMGRGRRTLAMPPQVSDALRRHRTAQLKERLAFGDEWPEEWTDLVFVSEAGTPLNSNNLRRELKEIADAAGIGHVTRYDLRHSAATIMAAAGMRLEDIADALGHEDLRMARGVYVHATGRTIDTVADVMGRAFNA